MKLFALCALAVVGGAAAVVTPFGPNGCVSLYRSQQGSCVFQTQCVGQDTSNVEFDFDCEAPTGEYQRHSFGVGGFEDEEEFDTNVMCVKCVSTTKTPKHVEVKRVSKHVEVPPVVAAVFASKVQNSRQQVKQAVVTYGPGKCVSTWRDANSSTCIVKTDCAGQDTAGYMYGLVCKDSSGTSVRHLFGKDSFSASEEFNTLIDCKECLALDKVPQTVGTALEAQVGKLAAEVGQIKESVKSLTSDVEKLNDKVGIDGADKKTREGEEKKGDHKKDEQSKEDDNKKDSQKKDEQKSGDESKNGAKKDDEQKKEAKSLVHTNAVKESKNMDSKNAFLHNDLGEARRSSAKHVEESDDSADEEDSSQDGDDQDDDDRRGEDQDNDAGDESSE